LSLRGSKAAKLATDLQEVPQLESERSLMDLAKATHGAAHHKSNEDRIFSKCSRANGMIVQTFGVCDGHGGDEASELVHRVLPNVNRLLAVGRDVITAYTEAFRECEQTFESQHPQSKAGACAVSATIVGSTVWCANLGDSRCAVIKLNPRNRWTSQVVEKVHWMSKDHKATNPDEAARVQKHGGQVVKGRVGGLVPTRCIGDTRVKDRHPGAISIEPEVRGMDLGENAEAIVICATDGVWDFVTGAMLSNIVEYAADPRDVQSIARRVVEVALNRGSRDDCSAICGFVSTAACDTNYSRSGSICATDSSSTSSVGTFSL